MTQRTLNHWVEQGCPHNNLGKGRGRGYRWSLDEVLEWLDVPVDHAKADVGEAVADHDIQIALDRLKLRTARLKAEELERKNAEAEGKLISREDQDRLEAERITAIRVGLEALSTKITARLSSLVDDPKDVTRVVETEVRALLETYAAGRLPE